MAAPFESHAPDYLLGKSDDKILAEYHRLLSEHYSGSDSAIWMLQAEIQWRSARNQLEETRNLIAATTQLVSSSSRLERLTSALIWLTVLLFFAAVGPAIETLCRLLIH